MKMFAKLLMIPVLALLPVLHALPVHAQADVSGNLDTVGSGAGLSSSDLPTVIGSIISVFLTLLGIIFLVLVLYAGWLWMTAGGDAKQVDKAKEIMLRAVVGLIILLAAYSISTFVITTLQDAELAG